MSRRDKRTAALLSTNDEGVPQRTLLNAHIILANDPEYKRPDPDDAKQLPIPRLQYDEFADSVNLDGRPWQDDDATAIALDMAGRYGLHLASERVAEAAIHLARQSRVHPVRRWLDNIPTWDGTPRCSLLLPGYFGCEDTPLNRELGISFLVSMVARVMQPGCKVDTVLCLVGEQGARKSTALRNLMPVKTWFSDDKLALGDKDFYLAARGVWLHEVQEIDGFRKYEWSALKAALSSPVDRYRPPYGRCMVTVPRQNVYAGTTNLDDWLGDPTGSRRFHVTRCGVSGSIDYDAIAGDRSALWAEAMWLYSEGREWWLSGEMAANLAANNQRFTEVDPWTDRIAEFLRGTSRNLTAGEILSEAIGREARDQTKQDAMRVAAILRFLGYVRAERTRGATRTWTRQSPT